MCGLVGDFAIERTVRIGAGKVKLSSPAIIVDILRQFFAKLDKLGNDGDKQDKPEDKKKAYSIEDHPGLEYK